MSDYASMLSADLEALAVERGIDTDKVKGSGAGGNVLKKDWVKALEKLDRKEAKEAAVAAEPETEGAEVLEDEAGDAPETAEVDASEEVPAAPPNVAAEPDEHRRSAIARLHRAVFGDDAERPEHELLTKAADLIDYLRRRK